MKYTLIEDTDGSDVHRFKLEDQSFTIEVIDPNKYGKTPYYNVIKEGQTIAKHLTHRQFITDFYEPNDGSDFGILVYRAQEMYLQLTEDA